MIYIIEHFSPFRTGLLGSLAEQHAYELVHEHLQLPEQVHPAVPEGRGDGEPNLLLGCAERHPEAGHRAQRHQPQQVHDEHDREEQAGTPR